MSLHWELPADGREAIAIDCSLPAGLMFGMHVYTTFRFPLAPRWQEAHWRRLSENARALGLDWPFSWRSVLSEMERLSCPNASVLRLSAIADVSGYSDFDVNPASPLPARLMLSVRPGTHSPSQTSVSDAFRLKTAIYGRPLPLLKLGAMPESILLKREARRERFDDVLFIRSDDVIREASTSNFFLIRRDQTGAFHLETPHPERDGCLPGIGRLQVSETAHTLGIAVSDSRPVSMDRLPTAEGAFLTNAVHPVRRIQTIVHKGREIRFPWSPEACERIKALELATINVE